MQRGILPESGTGTLRIEIQSRCIVICTQHQRIAVHILQSVYIREQVINSAIFLARVTELQTCLALQVQVRVIQTHRFAGIGKINTQQTVTQLQSCVKHGIRLSDMQFASFIDDQRLRHEQRPLLQHELTGKGIRQLLHGQNTITAFQQSTVTNHRFIHRYGHAGRDIYRYGIVALSQSGTHMQRAVSLRSNSLCQIISERSRKRQFPTIQHKSVCRIKLAATVVCYLTVDPIFISITEEAGYQVSLREAIIIVRRATAIRHYRPHHI